MKATTYNKSLVLTIVSVCRDQLLKKVPLLISIPCAVIVATLCILIWAVPTMLVWNFMMPSLFNLPALTLFQTVIMFVFIDLIDTLLRTIIKGILK